MATWGASHPPRRAGRAPSGLGAGVAFSGPRPAGPVRPRVRRGDPAEDVAVGGASPAWSACRRHRDLRSRCGLTGTRLRIRRSSSVGPTRHLPALERVGWGVPRRHCTSGPSAVYSSPEPARRVLPRDRPAHLPAGLGRWRGWPVGARSGASPPRIPTPRLRARLPRRRSSSAASTTPIYQLYWDGSAGWASASAAHARRARRRRTRVPTGWTCSVAERTWRSGPLWWRRAGWSPAGRGSTVDHVRSGGDSPGPGGLPQVFVRGVDRRLYQFYWDGRPGRTRSGG